MYQPNFVKSRCGRAAACRDGQRGAAAASGAFQGMLRRMAVPSASEALRSLQGENYISLETFKRDGTGVKTPVWFAREGHHVMLFTDSRSWKVKRLGRNDRVRLAACGVRGKVHGQWFDGTCERLEGTAAKAAHKALTKRYWLLMRVGNVAAGLIGRQKYRAYYRIRFDT